MPPRCPPLSLRVCPGYRTHCFQHPLPPTTPQQPPPPWISASPHSPPCTPACATRTLPHTPQNGPTERAATLCSPPPPPPQQPPTILLSPPPPPHPPQKNPPPH